MKNVPNHQPVAAFLGYVFWMISLQFLPATSQFQMVKTCETAIFHGPKVAVDEIPRYCPTISPQKKQLYYRIYHLVIQHSHGKSPLLIGKPSINRPFSMAMLNNRRVYYRKYLKEFTKHHPGRFLSILSRSTSSHCSKAPARLAEACSYGNLGEGV